jgi:MFS family permease
MVLARSTELGMTKATAGFLNSLTLLSSAAGGIVFGILADKIGRVRSLTASILIYSVASGACGLSTTVTQLAIFRVILGLGMGGEWGTGAALIAETWPAQHRSKALALMQSMWAIGEMIAVGATAFVLPRFGWRAVFFIGVLPALVAYGFGDPFLNLICGWKGRQDSLKVLLRPDLRRNGRSPP